MGRGEGWEEGREKGERGEEVEGKGWMDGLVGGGCLTLFVRVFV